LREKRKGRGMIVHSHWSHYDSNLEQAQFTRLHAVIAAGGEPR
jgi:hypothetical protein